MTYTDELRPGDPCWVDETIPAVIRKIDGATYSVRLLGTVGTVPVTDTRVTAREEQ